MSDHVNRAIALLESGQPIYYVGGHTGHVLAHEQGRQDVPTWADYINVEQILSVPGIGFAEMGPGDLGLVLGYKQVLREPYPAEMQEARERVFAACRARGIAFLETCTPENVVRKIDEGIRIIAGHREETARVGRARTQRTMPV
jgi:2-keto-3-deoxy-L-rhamnonate aldolase RhmA